MAEREHTLTKDCWCIPTVETVEGFTNYEAIVPKTLRSHVASLMQEWTNDGRSDNRIDNLAKSLVLAAYAWEHDPSASYERIEGYVGVEVLLHRDYPIEGTYIAVSADPDEAKSLILSGLVPSDPFPIFRRVDG